MEIDPADDHPLEPEQADVSGDSEAQKHMTDMALAFFTGELLGDGTGV